MKGMRQKAEMLNDIIENMREQLPLYLKMKEAVGQEEGSIGQENYDELHRILIEKDAILTEMDILERDAEKIKEEMMISLSLSKFNISELSKVFSDGKLLPLKEIMGQIAQLTQEILFLEGRNEKLLKDNMDKVDEGLKRVRTAQKVSRVYHAATRPFPASAFMNKKS